MSHAPFNHQVNRHDIRLNRVVCRAVSLGWLALVMFSIGCDDLSDRGAPLSIDPLSESTILPVNDTAWEWDPPPSTTSVDELDLAETQTLNGRLLFSVYPRRDDAHTSTSAWMTSSRLPKQVYIQLPLSEELSGTVSIALDPASVAAPVPVDGWLLTTFEEWSISQRDLDPFSSAQLLFNIARRHSNLLGDLSPRPLSLFITPQSAPSPALPPFSFDEVTAPRFDLTLPPLTELAFIPFVVRRDPNINLVIAGAQISLWRGEQRVSSFTLTDFNGQGSVAVWLSDLEATESAEWTVRVHPPKEMLLPILTQKLSALELSDSASRDITIQLNYPRLSSLISLPIRITPPEGDLEETDLWRISASQRWGEEVERTVTSPNPQSRRRGGGVWRSEALISLGRSSDLWVYEGDAVIFAQPTTDSKSRTLRLELSDLKRGEPLQMITQDKPLVRGQLRGELDELIQAQLKFKQLAWPWRDATQLSLGEYIVNSDAQGSFAVGLEPGVYAMTISPLISGYAPRVTLVRVPETEGLILAPRQVTVYRGAPTEITLSAEGTAPQPVQARLEISCLIPRSGERLQGTSLATSSQRWLTATLARGEVTAQQTVNLFTHEESCPPW